MQLVKGVRFLGYRQQRLLWVECGLIHGFIERLIYLIIVSASLAACTRRSSCTSINSTQ